MEHFKLWMNIKKYYNFDMNASHKTVHFGEHINVGRF